MSNATQSDVDPAGNILVHVRGSISIPISDAGEDGSAINIGSAPWFFVMGRLRKAIAADPQAPTRKLLRVSRSELDQHLKGNNAVSFAVVDESDPQFPEVRWEGRVIPRGTR